MFETVAQSWLTLQCQMIPNAAKAVAAFDTTVDDAVVPTISWPAGSDTEDLVDTARLAKDRNQPVIRGNGADGAEAANEGLHVACPLLKGGQLFGAVAVQIRMLPEAQHQAVVQLLRWSAAWLELLLAREPQAPSESLATVFDTVVAGLQHRRLEAAATGVATELSHRLSCERVSLGFLRHKHVKLQALSHSAHFEPRANLVRQIEGAMEEALAFRATIIYPPPPSQPKETVPAHARLAEDVGEEAICTVPLMGHDEPVGALVLERVAERPFDSTTVALCETAAAIVGPILEMKLAEERPAVVRLKDQLVELGRRIFGPRHVGLKVGLAVFVLVAFFLAFARGEYRVRAPATLEGTVQRAVVAPDKGYISAAHARAGEAVKAGTLLAELDDKDLRLEQRHWASEREKLVKQYREALSELDHPEARILRAQVAQAEARLELLGEQLARTRLLAPFDGVIIFGDLSRKLGTPVERGERLFEMAPLDAYRVALDVDERDIPDVRVGQNGYLALSAMPGERLPLVVDNVSTISQTEEGNAAFRVEARLDGSSGYLRPGMQGVAKIVAGERKLIWIWTRRLVGWVQLWLWSWWP